MLLYLEEGLGEGGQCLQYDRCHSEDIRPVHRQHKGQEEVHGEGIRHDALRPLLGELRKAILKVDVICGDRAEETHTKPVLTFSKRKYIMYAQQIIMAVVGDVVYNNEAAHIST